MFLIFTIIFIIYSSPPAVYASYCGQAAIPFTFQALSSGQPVLGCARPSCFGWNANGETAADSARFYRIYKKNDGYLRDGDSEKKNFAKYDFYQSQVSQCESGFNSVSCDKPNQWVGGIAPSVNITGDPLLLKCCTYEGLSIAIDRGVAEVGPGQIMVGGEISNRKRQYAFDYISNIHKTVTTLGQVVYSVTMKRFPCLAALSEPDIEVDERASSIIKTMNDWLDNKEKEKEKAKEKTKMPEKQKEKEKDKDKAKAAVTKQLKPTKKVQKETPKMSEKKKQEEKKDEAAEDEKIMKLLEQERTGQGESAELEAEEQEQPATAMQPASVSLPNPSAGAMPPMEMMLKTNVPMEAPPMPMQPPPPPMQNALPPMRSTLSSEQQPQAQTQQKPEIVLEQETDTGSQEESPDYYYQQTSETNSRPQERQSYRPDQQQATNQGAQNRQQIDQPTGPQPQQNIPAGNFPVYRPNGPVDYVPQQSGPRPGQIPEQPVYPPPQPQPNPLAPVPQTYPPQSPPSLQPAAPANTAYQLPSVQSAIDYSSPLAQFLRLQPPQPQVQPNALQPQQYTYQAVQQPQYSGSPLQLPAFPTLPPLPTFAPLPNLFPPLQFTPSPLFSLPQTIQNSAASPTLLQQPLQPSGWRP